MSAGFEDYRIEDNVDDDNVVLRCDSWEDACQKNNMYGSLHVIRAYLRRVVGYTFLIGDNLQHISSKFYHSMRCDGGGAGRSASKFFKSVNFSNVALAKILIQSSLTMCAD